MSDKLDAIFASDGWDLMTDDTKLGVIIHSKIAKSGLTCMKACGYVDYSPMQIFKVIGDDKYRKDYDETFDKGSFL